MPATEKTEKSETKRLPLRADKYRNPTNQESAFTATSAL
jgi:hypothetical protein